MLKEKTGIGTGLFFTVIISLLLGIGNQQTAFLAAKYGGHNGYLGLIGAYLISILVILAAFDLQKMYPGKSLIEYVPLILGKVLGKVIGFIFILLIFFVTVWSIRSTAEVINLYFLQTTPLWIIAVFFLVAIAYLAFQGIEGITKTCSFIFPMAFVFIVLTLVASYQYFQFDRIKPVLYINLSTLSSVLHLFYAFLPLSVIFIFLPYISSNRKGLAATLKSTGIGAAVIFLYIVANIGTYGADGVIRYAWPNIELTKIIDIPYLFQSFGSFYIIAWLSQIYIATGACYFASAQGFTQIFTFLHYKWFIIILFPIVIFTALFLPGVIDVRSYFTYFRIIGSIILIIIPLLLWATAKLQRKREG